MDFHGITMKGKYYAEQVSNPTGADTNGRVALNTGTTINGYGVGFEQNKLVFNNGTQWLRPLVGNASDGPARDSQYNLGSNSYRWLGIYADNFYGAVRYS